VEVSPETDERAGAKSQEQMRGVLPSRTRLRIYEVVRVLGQGAFGITYLARDTNLNRDVAIKEYLPASLALREHDTMVVPRSTQLADEFIWGRERFLDEARTLAKLESAPAVVRVIDFLEANGTAYMVMALVRGDTLEQRLRQDGRLGPSCIIKMLAPLMEGLEQVHQAGFLHRDIKPSNIIVDARDNPTLIDFGASRAAIAGRSTTLTAVFTPGYAAPEQFGSSSQGPWTDIYGLSATLYHAIAGVVPPNSVDRILEDTYRPLVQLAPHGFSSTLLAGIDAGLSVRALQRPQSIAEWRSLLRGVESPSPGSATVVIPRARAITRPLEKATPPLPARSAGLLRTSVLRTTIALALLLMAGGGYYVFKFAGQTSIGVESLTKEQLEQALAERREAEALAAEKKQLEADAARKAAADAEAKRKADAELERARQQRMRAEQELAKLKAEAEARQKADEEQRSQASIAARRAEEEAAAQRKADAEIAALRRATQEASRQAAREAEAKRQADEEARRRAEVEAAAALATEKEAQRKAEADAAAKRQSDEALAKAQADREKADAEVRAKAEQDAKARAELEARSEVEAKKRAEAAEQALNLPTMERQRLQVALTALGFDTKGTDGAFGPRSREMIAAWQKARSQMATGFLTSSQQHVLLKEAAAAVGKYDDEQRQILEDKKKAEEDAKKRAEKEQTARPTTSPAVQAPSSNATASALSGAASYRWLATVGLAKGTTISCGYEGSKRDVSVKDGILVGQLIGSGASWTLNLRNLNPDGSGQIVAHRNSDKREMRFQFEPGAGPRRIRQVSGECEWVWIPQ
jgi:serine/threonine protein kinase